MSLLDDVSIVVTPNGYKAGELYAVVPVPTEGAEEITNGDFATDANWTKNSGWTISGGSANCDGTQTGNSGLVQQNGIAGVSLDLQIGKQYKMVIDVTVISGAITYIEVASDYQNDDINATGVSTLYFSPTSTNDRITIAANSTFVGSVNSVSIKEYTAADMDVTRATAATRVDEAGLVNYAEIIGSEEVTDGDFSQEGAEKVTNGDFSADSNWNQVGSNGWSIDTGTSTLNFTNASSYVFQGISTVSGKSYKVTLDIELNSGTIVAKSFSAQDVLTVTSTGRQTVTGYFKEIDSNANFGFVASGSASGKIHSVSVKEVGADWSLGGEANISNGKLNIDGTQSGFSGVSQSSSIVIGKTYKVVFEVSNYVSGNVKPRLGNKQGTNVSSNGVFTQILTVSVNTNLYACYFDSSFIGSIDNVSVKEVTRDNLPRIDYTGGGCPHILAEPQRTNLLTYSEDFSQWNQVQDITLTANSTISPSGESNGTKALSTGNSKISKTGLSFTNGVFYTLSVYCKNIDATDLRFFIYMGGLGGDLTNVFTSQVNTSSWTKVSFTFTPTGTTTNGQVQIARSLPNGESAYFWGAQLEEGSFPTSYIPTSGSTVTRNQDQFSRDGIGSLINSTEGTLFVELENITGTDATNKMISITDGSLTNKISLFVSSNQISVESAGSGTNLGIYSKALQSGFNKIAVKYKVNDCAMWVNGTEYTDTSFAAFSSSTLNALVFDRGDGTQNLFGKVKQLQVYKTALTDAQLTSLTS